MALAYQHGPWWLTRFQANTWPSVATGATDIYSTLIADDLRMHATQTSMVPDVTMPCVANRPPTRAVFLSLSLLSFCLSPQNITVYFLFLFHFFVIYLPLIMGPTCSVLRGAGTQVSLWVASTCLNGNASGYLFTSPGSSHRFFLCLLSFYATHILF